MPKDDGGAVFPTPSAAISGIRLRDYIAIHASDGDIAELEKQRISRGSGPFHSRTQARYAFADAMIRARAEEK